LPIVRNLEGEEIEPILADANANYLPYYERLRSTLRLVGGGETVKVVIVTSITGGEGKTATAYNLAIAAALAGRRTLLVEGNLRSPSKSEEIGVTPDPNSFREPLLYYGAKSKSIRLAPNIENLSILPSPGPQKQAAAIIESSELQLILKDSRGRFDLVIVDTPSLSSCNDALLLEELADGIILVTRQAITRSSLLSEATDQLTEAEVKILGAVINYVDITPTLNTAEPELPPLIVPPLQEKTETEEVKVEV
jgi:capsular exopolysaccharide synthesis family protein